MRWNPSVPLNHHDSARGKRLKKYSASETNCTWRASLNYRAYQCALIVVTALHTNRWGPGAQHSSMQIAPV